MSGLVDDQVAAVPIRRYHPDSVLRATARPQYLKRAFNRDLDTGPDVYSFSLPTGISGRFVFVDTSVVLLPQQPVFIRRLAVDGFQISTEDGVRYLFQNSELTTPSTEFGLDMQHVSAWHLSQVISADAADTLTLHYTAATVVLPRQMSTTTGRYYTGTYQELGDAVDAAGPGTICGSTADYFFQNILANVTRVRAQFLESITAQGICLRVNRQLAGPNSVREIRSVQWFATGSQAREVRRWTLFQSPIYEATSNGPMPDTHYQLRLDSLRESANGVSLPVFRFDYLPIDLMPTKGSAAQDYWGYFNGAIENGDLAHMSTRPALLADTALLRRRGMAANREPRFAMVAQGALRTVTFPTGGQAQWDYELNRIAAQFKDLPLRKHATDLESSYDATRVALIENGPITHPATSSSKQEFDVPNHSDESGRFDVRVLLHRQPYDSTHATAGTNQVRDFSIWRRRASGDSLITNGPYRLFDGQLDNNQQPVTYRTFVLRLPPGRYVAQVHCEATEHQSDIHIYVPYLDSTDLKLGLPGPGIRVWRTTTQTAGAPPLVRTYSYSQQGSCSGVSLLRNHGRNFDRQQHTEINYQRLPTSKDHSGLSVTSCEFWDITADNRDLGDEFSKNVHYYHCVEEENGTNNGRTVYYFGELREQFNDVVLLGQVVYRRSSDNQLHQAESTSHTYNIQDGQTLPFIRVRRTVKNNLITPGQGIYMPEDTYVSDLYTVRASFAAPVQTVQTRYDEQGRAHTSITRANYVRQRLVRTATSTSAGQTIQRIKRLSDYTASTAVTTLRVNHFNPVVETQTWRRPAGGADSVLVDAQLTFFDLASRNPASAWGLRLSQPAAELNAEHTGPGGFTGFKSDTRYQQEDSVRYDPTTGRLRERRPPAAPPTTYLWGYDRAYVVAQVQNATYAQVLDILGQPTIVRLQGPKPGTDVQVRQLLEPLRTRLPQARVTTYTHRPLVGETSQTDPSGRTVFYEYDGLGRLLRTRDEQGRILSQQQYHYAGH